MNIEILHFPSLIAFWLCFSRWLVILFQLPLFDNQSILSIHKILCSFLITFAFFEDVKPYILQDVMAIGVDHFWTLTIFYSLVGLIIGFLVRAIMLIFISTGSILSQQIGFAAVNYFDPNAGQRVGPFEKFIEWVMVILIISSGALLPMFKGTLGSFSSIQLSGFMNLSFNPDYFLASFKGVFSAAIGLASPIIFTNLLVYVILGIIARTVPQMNVLMVSFVVNIGLGLLVFALISAEFFSVGYKIYAEKLGEWFQLVI